MCELFALDSPSSETLNTYLAEFFGHGDTCPHGWGLTRKTPYGIEMVKEPLSATESSHLKGLLETPIASQCAIAHIRYATKGDIAYTNTHPFLANDLGGNRWMFAHNGTIFKSDLVRPFLPERIGETDSEGILLYLLEVANKATKNGAVKSDSDLQQRFEALSDAIAELSIGNKLNLIFNDGIATYVHTNYTKESLYFTHFDGAVAFSTHPLSQGDWKHVPLTKVIAFQNGKAITESAYHGNIYIEDVNEIKHLYHEYAML